MKRMQEARSTSRGKPVNVLLLTRVPAIMLSSAYVIGWRFGGLDDAQHETGAEGLKSSGMGDCFAAVAR